MDRVTRDRFVASTDQTVLAYGESACLETPRPLFDKLQAEFGFKTDLTANEHNHLLSFWFGPGGHANDALMADWHTANSPGFSNPPYGAFIPLILRKAIEETKQGFTSVFLLPLRAAATKAGWYCNLVLPFADEVRHTPRITFNYQGKPKTDAKGRPVTALFDSILVVYRPHDKLVYRSEPLDCSGYDHTCCPHFSTWTWK